MSEPEGRGSAWTGERGTSDEGRRRLKGGPEASGKHGMTGAEGLARHGVTLEPAAAASTARFPDGAHFRIEIPSVEGPAVLRAVVEAAAGAGLTVNRVSQ